MNMHHKSAKSLHNLRTSISKEMAEFQTILLAQSRKKQRQNVKKSSSSQKLSQRIFNKSAETVRKHQKKDEKTKRSPEKALIKMTKSTLVPFKNPKHSKNESKLKKRGYLFSKNNLPSQKSLGSTKSIQIKQKQSCVNCSHQTLCNHYYEVIIRQRQLISTLQQIVSDFNE